MKTACRRGEDKGLVGPGMVEFLIPTRVFRYSTMQMALHVGILGLVIGFAENNIGLYFIID